MQRGSSSMTVAELRAYCEQTGQPMPALAPKKKGPHAKVALDLGTAVITVECEPADRARWRGWLNKIKESRGGHIVEW